MQFFSSDKRLQQNFFSKSPTPPQELNGRPLRGAVYKKFNDRIYQLNDIHATKRQGESRRCSKKGRVA